MINKNIMRFALATAYILLIPLVLRWPWTLFDFIFAGAFLFGSGLAYEFMSRRSNKAAYRAAVGIAVLAALLLVWITGAVGIIGSEDHPANLMYLGVLAVGIVGAYLARLRPEGMARALFATALAQAAVPVIALMIWRPQITSEEPGVIGLFALNAIFVMLWAGSALLFRRTNRRFE